jgi:hypothetical protein
MRRLKGYTMKVIENDELLLISGVRINIWKAIYDWYVDGKLPSLGRENQENGPEAGYGYPGD